MIVAITSSAPSLEAEIDPRFGRCPWFIIIDPDSMDFEAVPNYSEEAVLMAGIRAARTIADTKAEAVITGNCGPNAHHSLSSAGLVVYTGCRGTVRNSVKDFFRGTLTIAAKPNVSKHYGLKNSGLSAGQKAGSETVLPFDDNADMKTDEENHGGKMRAPGKASPEKESGQRGRRRKSTVKEKELAFLKTRAEKTRQEMMVIQRRINELERE